MRSKRAKYLISFLALLLVGQIIWWGFLIIDKQATISTLENTAASQAAYKSVRVMIFSEGIVFAIIWILGVTMAFRSYRREILLRAAHTNFLSAVTHELKTPIANVQLCLETLERPDLNESQRNKYIDRAKIATNRLNQEIETVLASTRHDYKPSQPEKIISSRILNEVIASFGDEGRLINTQLQADLYILTSIEEFRVVLHHILQNALKHTKSLRGEKSTVLVNIFSKGEHVIFEVTDNGPGLTESEIRNIFSPFWRSEHSRNQKVEGTGLGLLLTKSICENLGVGIDIVSEGPSLGTTVRLSVKKEVVSD